MKISINIEMDTENPDDVKNIDNISNLFDSIRVILNNGSEEASKPLRRSKTAQPLNVSETSKTSIAIYEEAWARCSWEIISFAVAVLQINEGKADKGTYTSFEALCSRDAESICGKLTDRAISSRVGRSKVISQKLGDFRLMEIGIRRKDKAKRVYVLPEAEEALLKLLRSDWAKEFKYYLAENGLGFVDFDDL